MTAQKGFPVSDGKTIIEFCPHCLKIKDPATGMHRLLKYSEAEGYSKIIGTVEIKEARCKSYVPPTFRVPATPSDFLEQQYSVEAWA